MQHQSDDPTLGVFVLAGLALFVVAYLGPIVLRGFKAFVRRWLRTVAVVALLGLAYAAWRQHSGGPPATETLGRAARAVGEAATHNLGLARDALANETAEHRNGSAEPEDTAGVLWWGSIPTPRSADP
ncbi:MAG: hypothetical protein ACRCT8_02640 [Lacipirellulaceae bacterium]